MHTIKSGNLMALIGEDGFVRGDVQGLYFMDTRFIGKIVPHISKELSFLGVKEKKTDSISFWFTSKANSNSIDNDLLYVLSYKIKDDVFTVESEFLNYSPFDTEFWVSFVIDYTFDDIFEIRGKRLKTKKFNTLSSSKENKTVLRETENADYFLKMKGPLHKKIHVSSKAKEKMNISFIPTIAFKRNSVERLIFEGCSTKLPSIAFPQFGGKVEQLVKRSVEDLKMLLLKTNYGAFPAAGLPWFSTIFGRDSLIFALQTMEIYPEIAHTILKILAITQAKIEDERADAKPGKIVHEIRVGELSLSRKIPFGAYYGSVDATPLFLMVIGEYAKHYGASIFKELEESINLAAEFLVQNVSKRGYLTYKSKSKDGLSNQGWKDSGNSIVFKNGRMAEPPIALVEVQVYLYEAYKTLISFYDDERSQMYLQIAKKLKEHFNEDFWMKNENFFALALDGSGEQVNSITSNPGHCLISDIIDNDRAKIVAERLMRSDMFTGWGIRTMSSLMSAYNPISYHNGTVWPHDNSIVLMGMEKQGFFDMARKLSSALLDAAEYFDWRLPELFGGNDRSDGRIIPYPVACSPQLWSVGAGFVISKILRRDQQ